ncbi:MAG TPA: adenylate/guanylate cyclase domain-containing protein [Solirubrobacteraceae bacterium]|jgi:class 3 adenylate cyclase|nr:adenylate/guanylate cyclase domain-containing protein [Solirubrobacteraceae bacterium]
MLQRALRALPVRLGPRYPRALVVAVFMFSYLVGGSGVGLLALYQDMSAGDVLRILLAVLVLVVIENAVATTYAFRLLRPADRWLQGDRSPEAAAQAWKALANLPLDFVARGGWPAVVMNVIPISAFVAWELDLGFGSFLIVCAGAAVCLLYGVLFRFFALELAMRPLLDAASCDVPDGEQLAGARIPLRWKLFFALPAINVVTGVAVAGLSSDPSSLEDLGWHVAVSVIVAFSISLELSLLLTRSVLDQIDALRHGTARVTKGDLGTRVPVLATDETGDLAASFNTMLAGLEERDRMREAFGEFVDPRVVDRVLEQGTTDLEGEEVEVSVLFLDIRGFTALAERRSAREVVQRLNVFYRRVVPVLERHGGHANKFVGDGVLGVFGAPQRLPDHADRAVLAALHIVEVVRDAYGDGLRIGVGVNSGPVLAGTVGGGGRVEFTVIGDAVNTAARVEEVTRLTGDDVLITEATRRLLTLPFCGFVERPTIALKGKTERVRLYAPLDAAASAVSA